LHRRALAALGEEPIDPNSLAALAFHADQAGDQESVLRYAPAAAERAALLGAHGQAAEQYALTLRHAKAVPEQQKAVWFEQHAFPSYCCGLGDAAVSSWREAIALRHALGDTRAEGDDLCWLSHELFALGRATEAADAGRASVQMLQDGGACPQLAR